MVSPYHRLEPGRVSCARRRTLCSGGNINSVWCDQLHVRNLGPHLEMLKLALLPRLGQECEQMLMIQPTRYVIEIGGEGNGGFRAKEIRFAPRFVGDLGKIILTPVHAPKTVAIMAYTTRIDRIDDDAGTLSLLNCGVHIGITRASASELVDAIGYYDNLAAKRTFGPALNQVRNRQVNTSKRSEAAERKPEFAGRENVIAGQILRDIHSAISHVADTNGRGRRL